MGDFITDFLTYTKFYESPTSFWKWSAYATIAAVLKDSVWKQEKDGRVHANIYVLLLADSAVQRKDRPVEFTERFIRQIGNTKCISGRSSIQALLDELAGAETDAKTGRISAGGQGIFIAPELSAGIVQDPQSVDILTDIYKSRDEFTSRLRGAGRFKIKNLCLSMMAASNQAMIAGAYDQRAVGGGLLGRTMLVVPNEFRPGNSLWEAIDTGIAYPDLVNKLITIAQLRGEFKWTFEAMKCFDSWYLPFREGYKNKQDASGIAGRVHTGALKLAMILCVAKTEALVVEEIHMEEAIEECCALIPNYQQLTMSTGRSPLADVHATVINSIYNGVEHCISRKKLLQINIMNLDAESLDKSVSTLEQAGLVNQINSSDGILYKLTARGEELFGTTTGNKNGNGSK